MVFWNWKFVFNGIVSEICLDLKKNHAFFGTGFTGEEELHSRF